MKKIKLLTLATVAGFALMSAPSFADMNDGYNDGYFYNGFTSHHLVDEMPYKDYAEQLPGDAKLELREYLNYEYNREPCQNYQEAPTGFVKVGCDLEPEMQMRPATTNVVAEYEIYFDFDKDNITMSSRDILAQVSNDIKRFNPREVTIKGHTDTSGSMDYNLNLSKRRALNVSDALTMMGIENRVLDKQAYGETDLAVPTPDGTRLRKNRRVTIQFRK